MPLTQFQGSLQHHFENNLPDYLELLQEMVNINSFTANPAGVNRLGRQTAAVFAPLGFTAETVQSVYPQYGKHLVLTKPGRSGRTIGLVSHLDTVFPQVEEEENDFHWRPEGDRIYGPGAVDIKGGTVLIYMMMSALAKLAPAVFDDVTWVVLLDASEEAHGADFGTLCLEKLGSDALACLVFEGGYYHEDNFNIVVARKGMAVYHVTVEGRAAHAGTAHQDGANAIVQLSDVIQQIKLLTDYERRLTFNVGTIAGGTVVNRVPHSAAAMVEMRCFDSDTFAEAMDEMLALQNVSTVCSMADGYACRVAVEVMRQTLPWPRNDGTDQLFAIWRETADSLGYNVTPEARGGLSDGNFVWRYIPTLDGLGVAGGNAHCSERSADGSKDQEYCLVSSFVPKAILNTMAVLKLLNNNGAV